MEIKEGVVDMDAFLNRRLHGARLTKAEGVATDASYARYTLWLDPATPAKPILVRGVISALERICDGEHLPIFKLIAIAPRFAPAQVDPTCVCEREPTELDALRRRFLRGVERQSAEIRKSSEFTVLAHTQVARLQSVLAALRSQRERLVVGRQFVDEQRSKRADSRAVQTHPVVVEESS